MLVTQQKILRRFWYPIVPADRLTDAPLPFTLLGTNSCCSATPQAARRR